MFLMKSDNNKHSLLTPEKDRYDDNHQDSSPSVKVKKGSLWSEPLFQQWIEEFEDQYDSQIIQGTINISSELTYLFTYF